MKKFCTCDAQNQQFTVISVDKERGQLITDIGIVDPFVGCAANWDDAQKMVGKTYEAHGFFHGTFLPKEGTLKEVCR